MSVTSRLSAVVRASDVRTVKTDRFPIEQIFELFFYRICVGKLTVQYNNVCTEGAEMHREARY